MKEELITYNTAKLAKEKGFDEPSRHYIWSDKTTIQNVIESSTRGVPFKQEEFTSVVGRKKVYTISIPTQSLLQRWLREEHKIEVSISWEQNMNWFYSIMWLWGTNAMITLELDDINNTKSGYKTYEEALEQGLIEALKLIEI